MRPTGDCFQKIGFSKLILSSERVTSSPLLALKVGRFGELVRPFLSIKKGRAQKRQKQAKVSSRFPANIPRFWVNSRSFHLSNAEFWFIVREVPEGGKIAKRNSLGRIFSGNPGSSKANYEQDRGWDERNVPLESEQHRRKSNAKSKH